MFRFFCVRKNVMDRSWNLGSHKQKIQPLGCFNNNWSGIKRRERLTTR